MLCMKLVSLLLFRLHNRRLSQRTIKSICNVLSVLLGSRPGMEDVRRWGKRKGSAVWSISPTCQTQSLKTFDPPDTDVCRPFILVSPSQPHAVHVCLYGGRGGGGGDKIMCTILLLSCCNTESFYCPSPWEKAALHFQCILKRVLYKKAANKLTISHFLLGWLAFWGFGQVGA